VKYHWEWVSGNQTVLYEEGSTFTGALSSVGIAAAINKSGPYAGSTVATYKVTEPIVAEVHDFASLEEAMTAVQEIVQRAGDTIERL
jgi:hypothetical protein